MSRFPSIVPIRARGNHLAAQNDEPEPDEAELRRLAQMFSGPLEGESDPIEVDVDALRRAGAI